MRNFILRVTDYLTRLFNQTLAYQQVGVKRDLFLSYQSSKLRIGLTLLIVFAACFVSSQIVLQLVPTVPEATLAWPTAGVAVAAVLLCGYGVAPAIFLSSLFASIMIDRALSISAGIALGETFAAIGSVYVLRRFISFDNDLKRFRDVAGFIAVTVFIGAVISASVGMVVLHSAGFRPESGFDMLWQQWALGHVNGVLAVAPLILVWLHRRFYLPPSFWWEVCIFAAFLVPACVIMFGPVLGKKFFIYPFLALAAFRFGQHGVALMLSLTIIAVIWALSDQLNIIAPTGVGMQILQGYMIALDVTGLVFGAAVTRRRDQEQKLRRYTQVLEYNHQQLDEFAYIVAHYLKEPLRGLQNFSHFLLEDYGNEFDDEGKRRLHHISDLTQRMESLLSALLHYARLEIAQKIFVENDLNDIVRNVVEILSANLKDKNTTVEVLDKFPKVVCERILMEEVFQNLIGNAIKYNDNHENKIEIGMLSDHARAPGKTVFYVRDHGIGIDEKHLEVIFKMFKRLHGNGDYGGGTGAGLSIVKKIIKDHGGDIWAESKGAGQGTTFFFTLAEVKE